MEKHGITAPIEAGTPLARAEGLSPAAAMLEDRIHPIRPGSVRVHVGIVTGEVTDLRVAEQIDQRSGRAVSPARLMGRLRLTNTASNQTVRLVAAKIQYLGAEWRPLELGSSRAEATFKFTTYGSERLDPGQEMTQAVDVAFPAEALEAKILKGLRLEIAYVPSPYREEAISFGVSIAGR